MVLPQRWKIFSPSIHQTVPNHRSNTSPSVFTTPGALVINPDTKRKLKGIRNNFVRIINSNQVSTFKLSDYLQKHGKCSSEVPQNFLRWLNTQVQSMDWNDMTPYSMPIPSQGLVTSHKRERSTETLLFPPFVRFSQPQRLRRNANWYWFFSKSSIWSARTMTMTTEVKVMKT